MVKKISSLSPLNSAAAHVLHPMLRKLELWNALDPDDRAALLALPFVERDLDANQYIVWEGDRPQHSCLLLSGYAFRHKSAVSGGRQIMSIHMKGDIIDLQNSFLGTADHNLQMLTAGRVALIPVDAMREIAFRRPALGMALWYETLVEGSIFREWILNIGRRDGLTRIAHLLCEFALRLEVAELGNQSHYELPISQEQLADAVALTSVHVNRKLMKLEQDGLIQRSKRKITVNDWQALAEVGDFHPAYLHVSPPNRQSAAGRP